MSAKHPWQEWLDANAAAGALGIIVPEQIVRGLPFEWRLLFIGHDFSDDDFEAEMRAAPDAPGDPLAVFDIEIEPFANGATPVVLRLEAEDTEDLPADDRGEGVEYLPFDVLHTPDGGTGTQYRRIAGLFKISGRITGDGGES